MYANAAPKQNDVILSNANNFVSWKAIFGGVVIALSITVVFNLIGLGLGFTAFIVDADVLSNIGLSSVLWLVLCSVISMWMGGWATGKLSSITYTSATMLSGLITWGIVTLVTFSLMASSMGSFLSGGLSLIERTAIVTTQAAGSVLSAAGRIAPSAAKVAQEVVPDMKNLISQINEQAEPLLDNLKSPTTAEESSGSKPISKETLKKRLAGIISAFLSANDEQEKNSAKSKAVTFLMQSLDMNEQVAQETITNWQTNYEEAKAQMSRKAEEAKNNAIAAAESASHMIGKIALMAAMINLLGAVAAIIGCMIGNRRKGGVTNNITLPVG